jgi:hypothetical protein
MLRTAWKVWTDQRHVHIVAAVRATTPDHDVVDDALACTAWPVPRVGPEGRVPLACGKFGSLKIGEHTLLHHLCEEGILPWSPSYFSISER